MNMADLFGKMQEMQENMKKIKESMDSITAEGSAGGGMVIATATGSKKIIKIKIDPEVIDKNDPDMLEDLICAAVNKALEEVEEKTKNELNKFTQNILPNIPGFDLSKFGL
jgi:DNA-binding YbaB/EbfC family protein